MKRKGIPALVMFVSSMLIFGTIGPLRRLVPLSSGMLAFSRGLFGAATLWIFARLRGMRLCFAGRRNVCLFALSGAFIGINWMLLFEAYNRTTVGIATLSYYMQPTIVILLSPLVLREKLTLRRLLCAAAALIGMVLVSGAAEECGLREEDMAGILCGLGAAAFYAAVVLLNQKIKQGDAVGKTVIQLLSAALVMVPYLLFTEKPGSVSLTGTAVMLVILLGVVHSGAAYALYFAGLKGLGAQSAAILSYIDPVFALVLSQVILGERLSGFGILGAVLIIGSAAAGEIRLRDARHAVRRNRADRG